MYVVFTECRNIQALFEVTLRHHFPAMYILLHPAVDPILYVKGVG